MDYKDAYVERVKWESRRRAEAEQKDQELEANKRRGLGILYDFGKIRKDCTIDTPDGPIEVEEGTWYWITKREGWKEWWHLESKKGYADVFLSSGSPFKVWQCHAIDFSYWYGIRHKHPKIGQVLGEEDES